MLNISFGIHALWHDVWCREPDFPGPSGTACREPFLACKLGLYFDRCLYALHWSHCSGNFWRHKRRRPGKPHPSHLSKIFTVLLYLTIGPCFALPRTASVSFQIGVAPFVPPGSETLIMALFTGVFMALALLMGLKPSKLIVYIGKFLNPAFLLFLHFLWLWPLSIPWAPTVP